jgi:DNA polymerase-3 subunit delta
VTGEQLLTELKKDKIRPCYYLYGEEPFLIEEALELIQKKLFGEKAEAAKNEFNCDVFFADEAQVEKILDSVQTLPFSMFGLGNRLVLVKRVEKLKAQQLEQFIPYINNPNPTTCLVFCAEKADTRLKFFKEFEKNGAIVNFSRLRDARLPEYIHAQLEKLGVKMDPKAIHAFTQITGATLHEINNNILKLIDYVGDRKTIAIDDLNVLVSDQKVKTVFDFSNAVGRGETPKALFALSKLLYEGQPEVVIFSMLVRHFRNLLVTREMLEKRSGLEAISEEIGIPRFFVGELIEQAKRLKYPWLQEAASKFAFYDRQLKSSKVSKDLVLEKLVLDLTSA